MLGIIGAMESEVSILKEKMDNARVISVASLKFFRGSLSGNETVIVRSGIGKVNAALCAQALIDKFGVSGIVNTGVAGSLRDEIDIGDIVISSDAVEHDFNAVALGYAPGEIPEMESSVFAADRRLVELAKRCCDKTVNVHVFEGRVVSGDTFVGSGSLKERLRSQFGGFCAEMEGGAIAHCAVLNNVPFVIIRSISDKANGSAHMDYPAFEKMAIKNSVRLIEELVSEYGMSRPY